MSRCNTPDTLIGVGGGGSKVVYKFMEQDWILEDLLDTESYERDEPGTLQAYTIDTATGDDWHDERYGPINRKIKSLLDDVDKANDLLNVGIEQQNIVESIPNRWTNTENMTAPGAVKELLERRNLNNWWLKDNREPLKKVQSDGFAGGVFRRRAVSKALYHINEYVGDSVLPTNPGQTAMVTTLGGGTGSGTFIDMAREMDAENIDLFAIIPSVGDQAKQKTNGLAALSELEYLWINNESPFRSVTLIPHVGSVSDDDFEMAAVRSILAQQNGMDGGNIWDQLNPGSTNGPPEFAGFTMAVPYTMEYEVDQRESAREEVEKTLTEKLEELTEEGYLYKVVETYLEENFPSAMEAVEGDVSTEPVVNQSMELRKRYEDVRDEFLTDDGLRVAGLDEERRTIRDQVQVQANGDVTIPDDAQEPEAARHFVEQVPDIAHIEPSNIDNEGALGYLLASVVRKEIGNIQKRRDLWKQISAITAENVDNSHALTVSQARMVRDVLRDIVLNPDQETYHHVQNPSFDETLEQIQSAVDELTEEHSQLVTLRDRVGDRVDEWIETWRDDVRDDASHVAAVNKHRSEIVSLINDLESAIESRLDTINDAATEEGMNGSLDFNSFDVLNSKLSAVGADPIDGEGIEEALGILVDIKTAQLDHNSGLLPGRPDKSNEFDNKYRELQTLGDWFTVNPERSSKDVRDPFNCVFDPSTIQRSTQIGRSYEDTIDRMSTAFDEQFTDAGTLIEFGPEDLAIDDPAVEKTVPADRNPSELRDQLVADLQASNAGDAHSLLDDVMPLDAGSTRGDSVSHHLYERYVQPFDEEIDDVKEGLRVRGGNDIVDTDGTVEALERLRAIAGAHSEVDSNISVPEVTPPEDTETYGRDFARSYEGIYQFDVEPSVPASGADHPYLRRGETNPEDLVSSPRSIEESGVLENHEDEIFKFFGNSVEAMFENRHGRAPINDFSPQGLKDRSEGEPTYDGLRYVPVYMSRTLEYEDDVTAAADNPLHPDVTDVFSEGTMINTDTYDEEQYDIGNPDEITMVTFIGGLTMDNLSVVTDPDGYLQTYREVSDNTSFIPTHHTVGIGGMWQYWAQLHEWTRESADDVNYGAYVFRDEVRPLDMDEEFVMHMNDDSDEEVAGLLNDLFGTGRFPSMLEDEQAEQN